MSSITKSTIIDSRVAVPQQNKILFGTVMDLSSDGQKFTVLYDDGSFTKSFPKDDIEPHVKLAQEKWNLDTFGPYVGPMKEAFRDNRENAFKIWSLSDLSDIQPPESFKLKDFRGLILAKEKTNGKLEFAHVVGYNKCRKNGASPKSYKYVLANHKHEKTELSYMELLVAPRLMTKHTAMSTSARVLFSSLLFKPND
jgi:hypothetical protein